MAKTRTFIGIDTSPAIRAAVATVQQQLAKTGSDVRWSSAESLHITLLFLGDLDDRELVTVCRRVTAVASGEPPFTIRVRGVGAFPTAHRPKVLWAGFSDGMAELQRIHGTLESSLIDEIGYRPEDRDYQPHLTLGRVTAGQDVTGLAGELSRLLAWDGGEATAKELLVYRSDLRRGGPEYSVIGRGSFGSEHPTRL